MNQFDTEFLQKLIKKDPIIFAQFYEQTMDIFYRFLKSAYTISEADIQDILSEFYTKVWSNLESIKLEYKFESFIWTILRNTAKDFFATKKIYTFSELEYPDDEGNDIKFEDKLVWDEGDYISILQNDYEYDQIKIAMSHLEPITQQIIFLKYIQWLDFEEISSELCISNDNVRQKLSRWIRRLKDWLDKTTE